jgi:spoIIIJ-associated protein
MAATEFSAPDVETAIAQGLQQLNLLRAEVKIEVLDEGSRGVLGIGAKPARIRLTPYAEIEAAEEAAAAASKAAEEAAPIEFEPEPEPVNVVSAVTPDNAEAALAADIEDEDDEPAPKIEGEDLALNITRTLLDRMGLANAKVSARSVFPANSDDEPSIWIDIDMDEDDDLLLNHQHEGLSSLQTIVQTMWSHQTKSSLRVNIDVNGFRSRRETQLINMAKRMAERVVASGKPITLEPMPANERRIIHMTLREEPGVTTESFGEGPSRKVQIKPQSK